MCRIWRAPINASKWQMGFISAFKGLNRWLMQCREDDTLRISPLYIMGRHSAATSWTVRGSNPGSARYFPHPSRPPLEPTRVSYTMDAGFSRDKERPGRDTDPSPLLVPWSWKSRAIPLLFLWAFVACSGVNFTFTFTYIHYCSPSYKARVTQLVAKTWHLIRQCKINTAYHE
jgi:hypothetical protein